MVYARIATSKRRPFRYRNCGIYPNCRSAFNWAAYMASAKRPNSVVVRPAVERLGHRSSSVIPGKVPRGRPVLRQWVRSAGGKLCTSLESVLRCTGR